MHFMPEDEGYEEKLWPDGYRAVIKDRLAPAIEARLHEEDTVRHVHARRYAEKFPAADRFTAHIAQMLVIGAEKGADAAFDDIINAFLYELPLPEPRRYARYLLFPELPERTARELIRVVVDEYREDEVFVHAYKVGYWDLYADYDAFLNEAARLAAVGAVNGLDDMLCAIYRAFAAASPLPPARRNPKRIKNWFVPKGSKIRDVPLSRRGRKRRKKENGNAENSDLR